MQTCRSVINGKNLNFPVTPFFIYILSDLKEVVLNILHFYFVISFRSFSTIISSTVRLLYLSSYWKTFRMHCPWCYGLDCKTQTKMKTNLKNIRHAYLIKLPSTLFKESLTQLKPYSQLTDSKVNRVGLYWIISSVSVPMRKKRNVKIIADM